MKFDQNWVQVLGPTAIYVGIVDREEFDKIALPVRDAGANGGNKVLVKSMEQDGVMVVFQHWYGPTPAEQAANEAVERMRRGAGALA